MMPYHRLAFVLVCASLLACSSATSAPWPGTAAPKTDDAGELADAAAADAAGAVPGDDAGSAPAKDAGVADVVAADARVPSDDAGSESDAADAAPPPPPVYVEFCFSEATGAYPSALDGGDGGLVEWDGGPNLGARCVVNDPSAPTGNAIGYTTVTCSSTVPCPPVHVDFTNAGPTTTVFCDLASGQSYPGLCLLNG